MVNIILSILIVNLFIHYITKIPYTALSCGIWGYFGKDNKRFNWKDFNMLGVLNDKRGGDAAGRMIGGSYEHYNSKNCNTYTEIIRDNLNPAYKEETVMFGHTRKTSAFAKGTGGIEFTQPYPVRDITGTIIGMGMHNGTLYNDSDLKEEYGVPDKLEYIDGEEIIEHSPNDSQILFWTLLVKEDYSILEKYQGSAALAWFDFREDRLYLFKGSSKSYEKALNEVEERPLYLLKEKDNIWFSSEETPLWVITQKQYPEIDSISSNEIHVFEEGKLIDTIKITRKAGQYKKSTYSSNYNTGWGSYKNKPYNNYDAKRNSLPANTTTSKANKIEEETLPILHESIAYAKGRYWDNKGKKAHGIYHLDKTGKIHDKPSGEFASEWVKTKPYYFIDGCMITDHISFQEYMKKFKDNGNDTKQSFIMKELCRVSVYPVHKYGTDDTMCCWNKDRKDWWYFTGEITPLFSSKEYEYIRGSLKTTNTGTWKFADHSDISEGEWITDSKEDESAEAYEQAYQEYEKYNKSNPFLEKLPFDDDYESPEDQMIKREVVNEVANALKNIQDCINVIQVYEGSKPGNKAIAVLEEIENKLSEIGDND